MESDESEEVIVPCTTGAVMVCFWVEGEHVYYQRRPVHAWAVNRNHYYVTPVGLEPPAGNETRCVEERCGDEVRWVFPEECDLDSFEKAREYALERMGGRRAK